MNIEKSNGIRSRNILLVMFSTFLLMDLALIAYKPEMIGYIRFVLTILLMGCVVQGYKWAKWLFVALWSLATLILIGFAFYIPDLTLLIQSIFISMAVLFSIIPIYIVKSNGLKTYFEFQRGNNAP